MTEATQSARTAHRRSAAPGAGSALPSTAYFQRMTRKEARIREDQYIALSRLVPVLARRRLVRSGPRLTENTLIRVAIDLLLSQADRLAGDTEAQLRASVLPQEQSANARREAGSAPADGSGPGEPGQLGG